MKQDKKQDNSELIKKAENLIDYQNALREEWEEKHKGKGPIYKVLKSHEGNNPEAGKELISIYKKLGVKNLKEFNALKSTKKTGGFRDSFLDPGIENID